MRGSARFGIDIVRGDAEAVLRHDVVEALFDLGVVDQRNARAIGGDRLAPHLAALERMRQCAEQGGALRRVFALKEAFERGIAGGGGKIVLARRIVLRELLVGLRQQLGRELQPERRDRCG